MYYMDPKVVLINISFYMHQQSQFEGKHVQNNSALTYVVYQPYF